MPSLPLNIAILECDTPLTNTREQFGGYGGVFKSLLVKAAIALSISESDLRCAAYDVVTAQEYPTDLSSLDGILITGSKHNAFEDLPWILRLVEFVQQCFRSRIRVVGVCFGHQIVGRALGATVTRSEKGWEASVVPIELTTKGQELFGRSSLALYQMHRDIVPECPPGVEQLAYTERCAVQGMYVEDKLITVQGHPEFTEPIVREILSSRHKMQIFDDAMYQDCVDRVDKEQDGVAVAQAFLRFLLH